MEYEGTVYRPPSEARSLIIQVTVGCAHNRCTFCNMYRTKKFRVRTKEEIMKDLDECRDYYGPYVSRVFFADGDALVVKTELLLELLRPQKFPVCGADHLLRNCKGCSGKVRGRFKSLSGSRTRDGLYRSGIRR